MIEICCGWVNTLLICHKKQWNLTTKWYYLSILFEIGCSLRVKKQFLVLFSTSQSQGWKPKKHHVNRAEKFWYLSPVKHRIIICYFSFAKFINSVMIRKSSPIFCIHENCTYTNPLNQTFPLSWDGMINKTFLIFHVALYMDIFYSLVIIVNF